MRPSIPGWGSLKRIGRHRVVSSTYYWVAIVPIGAKFLDALPSQFSFIAFNQQWEFSLTLPFSWQAAFFAALFFAAGETIYLTRCPQIVRETDDYSDFREQGKGPGNVVAYFREVALEHPHDSEQATFKSEEWTERAARFTRDFGGMKSSDTEAYELFQMRSIEQGKEMRAYWFVRDEADFSRALARAASTGLFVFGFSLLAWIVLANVIFVVRQTF